MTFVKSQRAQTNSKGYFVRKNSDLKTVLKCFSFTIQLRLWFGKANLILLKD